MMLMSGLVPDQIPGSLHHHLRNRADGSTHPRSTVRMDAEVDFRQTFGMSELGIVRVKSESRKSLFMKGRGEG